MSDRTEVHQVLLALVYGRAKVANQEHCPIGDLLGPPTKESKHLEYKATLRTHAESGEGFAPLETATIKTVAVFLNSDDGGTLLLGVDDGGRPRGLAEGFASLHKDGKDDRDLFDLHLGQTLANALVPRRRRTCRSRCTSSVTTTSAASTSNPAGFPS